MKQEQNIKQLQLKLEILNKKNQKQLNLKLKYLKVLNDQLNKGSISKYYFNKRKKELI